jgi:hypothetical protein
MDKRHLFAMAAAALLAGVTPAAALDNVVIGSGRCDCMCETANAGNYGTYDSVGYGCGALEGKTCNIENPQTGLIETGRLWGCSPTNDDLQSRIQGGLQLDPGDSAQPGGPSLAAPLFDGSLLQR